jgi:hemoglobin
MQDIKAVDDIRKLVDSFYEKVKQDTVIGFIFHDTIGTDWSHHLPIMYSFWSMVLLNEQGYVGNPIKKHIDIDKRIPLQPEHYDRWLQLWVETVDEYFKGDVADEAKKRGKLMIDLIQYKVDWARQGKSIQ